jgi:hypothetical protein
MARVSYVDVPVGDVDAFYSSISAGNRFAYSRLRKKSVLLGEKRKLDLAGRSLLSVVADVWRTFTTEQKAAWSAAAAEMSMTGYRLFVQDQCTRLKAGLTGSATPGLLHQSFVGQLHIEAPANELKIVQYHPDHYFVRQKVPGHKSMYAPVLVQEAMALPITIELNYKAALSASGGDPYAKFYAYIHYLYQGRDLYHTLVCDLDLVADWKNTFAVLSSIASKAVHYDLFLHLHDVVGDLYIDNVSVVHGGQNWCRDPFCKDINQGFTSAFYQVPKHWTGLIVPNGAEFESVYKDF